jgi:4-hydroxy 2-oxovalerate aldolase
MLPPEVRERVTALREALTCRVGFHAHNNLGLAIGNTLAALEAGAEVVDASLRAMGAGGGNAPTETLIAVLHRLGFETGVDLYKVMDAAKLVDPFKFQPKEGPDATLMLGYAGVYSSFLLHTARAAERFGVDPRDILVELGRRRVVGGQEDMIIDVAYELAQKRSAA